MMPDSQFVAAVLDERLSRYQEAMTDRLDAIQDGINDIRIEMREHQSAVSDLRTEHAVFKTELDHLQKQVEQHETDRRDQAASLRNLRFGLVLSFCGIVGSQIFAQVFSHLH